MRERDADRFVAHHAPQIVKFDLPPSLALMGSEARDAGALRAFFASHPGGPIDYEIRDLTATVGGDVVFCHSLSQLGDALSCAVKYPAMAAVTDGSLPTACRATERLRSS